MALTYLTIEVTHPTKQRKSFKRRFLVDSGAVYTVIPKSELFKLKIKSDTTQKFILANGQEIEKEIGEARLTWENTSRTVPVVFGDEGVFLLGATALEAMGVILDPIGRKLKRLPMVI